MTSPPRQPVRVDVLNLHVTVVNIRCRGSAPNECSVGSATGFFFRNGDQKYLITNKHVVHNEERNFYPDTLVIRVHTSRTSMTQNREINLPLYDSSNQRLWLEHQNRVVDIAAIKINDHVQEQDVIFYFDSNSFPPSDIVLGAQDNCVIIGYPLGFYDIIHNLPITRIGAVASPYGAHFRGIPLFLVDAVLHEGTSGSPVILPSTSVRRTTEGIGIGNFPPCLLGINSGEWSVDGSKLGLNAVWYSTLIQEMTSPPQE